MELSICLGQRLDRGDLIGGGDFTHPALRAPLSCLAKPSAKSTYRQRRGCAYGRLRQRQRGASPIGETRAADAHNLERRIEREVPSRLCAPREETSRSMRR
jgi:hypothetical protein